MKYFLAIETSCDETSLALFRKTDSKDQNFLEYLNSYEVISSVIASQAKYFAEYGGVIPEISARHHAEQIFELFDLILTQAESKLSQNKQDILKSITTIFVTTEPGLVSALRVGQEFGKVIQHHIRRIGGDVVLTPINHLRGHIVSAFYQTQERSQDSEVFPHLHLLVSGGNTQLLLMKSPSEASIVAQTLDDAAGECLDKIGRMVGLSYPAGATIGAIVGTNYSNLIQLPVSMKAGDKLDFSYSGIKTAVRYYIRDHANFGLKYEQSLADSEIEELKTSDTTLSPKLTAIKKILTSTQAVVIEQLIMQTKKAISQYKPRSIGLSGGVSASKLLREKYVNLHDNFFLAPMPLTGDNAVMIGLAGVAAKYNKQI